MKIKKLELINFKRFTHLTIDVSQGEKVPKLVLLIGVNGSGKSSVFDALAVMESEARDEVWEEDEIYYEKNGLKFSITPTVLVDEKNQIYNFNQKESYQFSPNNFYGRSSLRQVPRLTRNRSGLGINLISNDDRPKFYIDRDERFENDLEEIGSEILTSFFANENISSEKVRELYIEPLNKALRNIFGENPQTSLSLKEIIPPLSGNQARITFTKGNSTIHYNLLSSGEKEVFNIILNLFVRRKYYQDTVYFIDELDLHLNTKLQKTLLKEITENWIPENCQLWTASHSIGFIEYANESPDAAIIDLDNLDFDLPQIIEPSPKNNYEVFEIAVSKELLSELMSGKKIVFSENTDTFFYNSLAISNTIFFSAIDKKDVFYKTQNLNYFGLIDRDYLTDEEVEEIERIYPKLKILKYYSLENYLYHPDNLEEYFSSVQKSFDKKDYILKITDAKNTIKDKLIFGINGARTGYPFFKENENDKLLKKYKENGLAIVDLLKSDDFETFYKVFPTKDEGKNISERQNLNKKDLAATQWFKQRITQIFS